MNLGIGAANQKWHCTVTLSLIGWSHTQNDPCWLIVKDQWSCGIHLREMSWEILKIYKYVFESYTFKITKYFFQRYPLCGLLMESERGQRHAVPTAFTHSRTKTSWRSSGPLHQRLARPGCQHSSYKTRKLQAEMADHTFGWQKTENGRTSREASWSNAR